MRPADLGFVLGPALALVVAERAVDRRGLIVVASGCVCLGRVAERRADVPGQCRRVFDGHRRTLTGVGFVTCSASPISAAPSR